MNPVKLHLACGDDYIDGYVNVDLYNTKRVDAKFDIRQIPYESNSVDEIKAFHIIEHFDWFEIHDVLILQTFSFFHDHNLLHNRYGNQKG